MFEKPKDPQVVRGRHFKFSFKGTEKDQKQFEKDQKPVFSPSGALVLPDNTNMPIKKSDPKETLIFSAEAVCFKKKYDCKL